MYEDPYGEEWSRRYDELYADRDDIANILTFIDAHAPGSVRILEFGVGTGRLARPLALRDGVRVTGIDNSAPMLQRLAEAPEGARVEPVLGDAVSIRLGRTYDLALMNFNFLYLMESRDDQELLIRNAARHLRFGGRLIIETFVYHADDQRETFRFGGSDHRATLKRWWSPDGEVLHLHRTTYYNDDRTTVRKTSLRYLSPAAIDDMAASAGFDLILDSGGWRGKPRRSESTRRVAVYSVGERPA